MAVTITNVHVGTELRVVDIEATADGDTTATIAHGLTPSPFIVAITGLLQVAAGLSEWAATTVGLPNVICTKSTAVGSGVAGDQIRVAILTPNTMIQ